MYIQRDQLCLLHADSASGRRVGGRRQDARLKAGER
ncbi:hypothetical protein ALC62_00266 [Cyphomyrmex costatus]|uniref:Uncharacterized protein n=1 Tax=Cyphomyrmex costatus TaxID=456900 RepID=A0A195D7E7_9HYME|nr:hypothetical protein ALC62_00266 [Cyphomyrmex costatus]